MNKLVLQINNEEAAVIKELVDNELSNFEVIFDNEKSPPKNKHYVEVLNELSQKVAYAGGV